jgi:hypothetical protein
VGKKRTSFASLCRSKNPEVKAAVKTWLAAMKEISRGKKATRTEA